MNELIFVAGARPNFMKVAPIMRALESFSTPMTLIHTGQHYDANMSGVFFDELGLRAPDVNFGIGAGTHAEQTAAVLIAMERHLAFLSSSPAGVVVVGDVNSTVAAAMAATKLQIPVAHVEAGLRSFDRRMPEELNRLQTDAICDLLLVSEPSGEANLLREGVPPERIRYVGNVMIDSLVQERDRARALGFPQTLGLRPRDYVVATVHRPANVDDPEQLLRVVELLEWTATRTRLVFPVHPRTRKSLQAYGLLDRLTTRDDIVLRDPCSYRELLGLMDTAAAVITDSGGIQEESSYLGVPCFTIRPNTERPSTVEFGTNNIVGPEPDLGRAQIFKVLEGTSQYKAAAVPGWDGLAGKRIARELIAAWLN